VHQADSPSLGLNLRAGGLFPNGFLLPANLANVLEGLPEKPPVGLPKGFFPPGFPNFFAEPLLGLPVDPAGPPEDLRSENPRLGFFSPYPPELSVLAGRSPRSRGASNLR
jgi:hypothetical protein